MQVATATAGPPVDDRQILTNSRESAARACLRLDRYQYQLGYESVVRSDALYFGTIWHNGLEAWWSAVRWGKAEPLGAALYSLQMDLDREQDRARIGEGDPPDPFLYHRARALLTGYDARWSGVAETYEVLAVERPFTVELINPESGRPSRTFVRKGKVDLLLRERFGARRFMLGEHKSSSEDIAPGSPYWVRLRMDSQVSVYYRGADGILAELGHEGARIDGCAYFVTKKPALRPLKATPEVSLKFRKGSTKEEKAWAAANPRDMRLLDKRCRLEDETPVEYEGRIRAAMADNPDGIFALAEVVRLESEMEEHDRDSWLQAGIMREAMRAGCFPRNPDACFDRYGRRCEFLPVCTGEADLDDPTLFRRIGDPFPELAP